MTSDPDIMAQGSVTPPATWSARSLLKDRAYVEIKELIQTGMLPPDASFSERQLAERLGMSKTPIRSALEHLESQGLLVVSPRRGVVVRDLSAREVAELFDVRSAIEPYVVSRLAGRPPSGGPAGRIGENLGRQRDAASAGDAVASTRLDVEFHSILAGLLDNREATAWLERCFDRLHRSILRVNRLAPDRLMRSHEDHAAIAAAILAGQGDPASRLMVEHLGYGRAFLLAG